MTVYGPNYRPEPTRRRRRIVRAEPDAPQPDDVEEIIDGVAEAAAETDEALPRAAIAAWVLGGEAYREDVRVLIDAERRHQRLRARAAWLTAVILRGEDLETAIDQRPT